MCRLHELLALEPPADVDFHVDLAVEQLQGAGLRTTQFETSGRRCAQLDAERGGGGPAYNRVGRRHSLGPTPRSDEGQPVPGVGTEGADG